MSTLDESDVGISAYANKLPGFTGILKHRFSDFKVYEVAQDGTVAKPGPLSFPDDGAAPAAPEKPQDGTAKAAAAPVEGAAAAAAAAPGPSGGASIADLAARFREVSGSEDAAAAFKAWAERTSTLEAGKKPEEYTVPPDDNKERRRNVHQFFKESDVHRAVGYYTTSEAANRTGHAGSTPAGLASAIVVRCQKKFVEGQAVPNAASGQQQWKTGAKRKQREPSGRYMRVMLLKENHDTQHCVGLIARALGTGRGFNPKTVSFAGTKDKRGVTCQFLTLPTVPEPRLRDAAGRVPRARLCGAVSYTDEPLRLGELRGNVFEVVLRDVARKDPELITAACESLRTIGFINFFGLQRFGTGKPATHELGALLLKGSFEEVVRLIMTCGEAIKPEAVKAREAYERGEYAEALKLMPRWHTAERAILEGIQRNGATNHVQNIMGIPRTLRMMYLHAFQSFVWNHAASRRVELYGATTVVAGDLVLLKDAAAAAPEAKPCSASLGEARGSATQRLAQVHVVSAADVASGRFTMDDVVLPLPGTAVQYPENQIGEVYKSVMADHGISNTAEHKVEDLSFAALSGDYRRVMQRIPDLKHRLVRYREANEDILTNDVSALGETSGRGGKPAQEGRGKRQKQDAGDAAGEGADAAPGAAAAGAAAAAEDQSLALVLEFFLPSSCYATMAVRELFKGTTSKSAHAARSLAGAEAAEGDAAGAAGIDAGHDEGEDVEVADADAIIAEGE